MRFRNDLLWLLTALAAAAIPAAHAQTAAPQNLAPNSQWEIWSGVNYGTAENTQGTGTVGLIAASANTTGTAGQTTFTVSTTDQLKPGDLVKVSGAGVDASLVLSPMRVTALVANSSITVRVPLGLTPTVNHAATIQPVVVGNLAAIGTGDAADRWKKTVSMPIWRENNAVNVPDGAYYSMGLTKDGSGAEHVWTEPNVKLYAGRTVTFGIYVNHKVRTGSGTWQIFWNTSAGGASTCAAMPAAAGWQWQECSITVPAGSTYLNVGVQFNGNAGDTYYLANPVFTVGSAIGGVANYTKPRELFTPVVHLSPITWVNAGFTFPATPTGGVYGFTMDPYAETGGQIAPTVGHAWGQLEGIDGGAVQVNTGYVRVLAWYDRVAAPERSGSFLPQYVASVKSFSTMDFPLNTYDDTPAMRGTASVQTGVASDHWSNVSLEFDQFLLD